MQSKTRTITVVSALLLALAPASANSVLKQSSKLHRDGMVLWRNGDFLGAFGSCFGAKQLLKGIKDAKPEAVAEAMGYAELCIGLSLQQMKVKGGPYNTCKSFVATKKQFAIVDAARKSRGEKLADGGYMDEQLKEANCK